MILDRSLVRIGSRVIFGTGARLNPHVIAPAGRGEMKLYLAPITIGDDALFGASSHCCPGAKSLTERLRPVPHHPCVLSLCDGGRRVREEIR